MKTTHVISFILVAIGGLNWLLIGLFNWGVADLVSAPVAKIIYILVGLATLVLIFTHKKNCRMCGDS
ncbi:MAG: hypothetical protein JWO00_97, partial [Candidatus Parcubacteria bacterium]|nr:hypothetical protein [Candidatus Parcubacteria bacterium]